MISHNTFLQNFLQDFFNCQIIRGFFTHRLPQHASSAYSSPEFLPVNLSLDRPTLIKYGGRTWI